MTDGRSAAPLGIRVTEKERKAILWKARGERRSIASVVYPMLQAGGLADLVKEFSLEQPEEGGDNA